MTSKLLPMLRTDVAGKLVEWNDQLAELTGIPSREVLGEPLVSHVLPSSHTRVQQMLSRALQGHVEKSVHVRLRCRVGVQLALSVGASCHYSLAGDVLGVVVVGQPPAPEDSAPPAHSVPAPPVADDVGDSSAQLVLDCAGVAMVSTDKRGSVCHWNPRLEALSGYSKGEVIGQKLWQLPPFDDCGDGQGSVPMASMLKRAFRGERVHAADVPLRTKRGAGVLLQMSASPIDGEGPMAGGVVLIGVEVTSARALEEQKLAAARLRASRESKQDFLASISHELRTPLNGLLGSLQLALQRPLTHELLVPLTHAKNSASHLMDIVNDLISLSAIESGTLQLERRRFDLCALCDEIAEQIAPRMAAKKLSFELTKGATLPTMVMGDRHRLQQILSHLLENGLQFTKRGRVAMSAVLIDQDDTTFYVRISVEDTGIGIKPENKATLFSLFSKLPPGGEAARRQSDFARKGRGAGVGLAISQQLIELMGGEIKCESEYGRGSRFEASIALEKTPSMSAIEDLPASPHPVRVRVPIGSAREGKPEAAPAGWSPSGS